MFILSLTYKKPLEEVDKHIQAHIDWLKESYANGTFLASGRKVPRTGGVILAKGEKAALEVLCASDPFSVHNIADYEITEVALTTVAEGLELLGE